MCYRDSQYLSILVIACCLGVLVFIGNQLRMWSEGGCPPDNLKILLSAVYSASLTSLTKEVEGQNSQEFFDYGSYGAGKRIDPGALLWILWEHEGNIGAGGSY